MSDAKRQLLQKLADAGKPTTLSTDELVVAQLLEADGLIFKVQNTTDAIIMPAGRHRLANNEFDGKPRKKPFGSAV